jgi:regulatory protein
MTPPPTSPARKRPRRTPSATPESLRKAALAYLGQRMTTVAHLRRLLLRRVARAAEAGGGDPQAGAATVEALLSRLSALGLLDDAVYATARARGLLRRGASERRIRRELALKGVARAVIDQAIEALADEVAEPELAAALRYARRRKLGPYRACAQRADARARDLAILGRQGFDYPTARRVVDCQRLEALEREAGLDPFRESG